MRLALACVTLLCVAGFGQNAKVNGPESKSVPAYRLELIDSVTSESELAGLFAGPLPCDADGNVYFTGGPESPVRKIDRKGKKVAEFQAVNQPDFQVQVAGYYFVGLDGEFYQLTFKQKSLDRYVFEYRPDGTLKDKVKLDAGIAWSPNQIAVFPSGIMLAAGQRLSRSTEHAGLPFTGLFAADGRLLREIILSDDEKLMNMAAEGDPQINSTGHRSSNFAVSLGSIAMAGDGNAYLMRKLNPAIVYVISPSGEVLRRFTVKSTKDGVVPIHMHASKSRIAIQFWSNETKEMQIKVVDLDGNEVARYENSSDGNSPKASIVFTCYTENPDRLTFMSTAPGNKLAIKTFGAK